MAFETHTVPRFGGGLNLEGRPDAIQDDQWTFSDGFIARDGVAEVSRSYTQINNGSWQPAGTTFIGIVPDLTFGNKGKMLLVVATTATNVIRLFRMTSVGVATEIPVSGTAPVAEVAPITGIPTTAFINAVQVVACGPTALGVSVFYYDGTNFFRIPPTVQPYPVTGGLICDTAGHLIVANTAVTEAGKRHVLVSDANSYLVWRPDVSNSADSIDIEGEGDITGLASWQGGATLLTQNRCYQLQATGSIPPFIVRIVDERGCIEGFTNLLGQPVTAQQIVATPYGPFFNGNDDFYFVGSPQGYGRSIFRYMQTIRRQEAVLLPKLLWHPELACVICTLEQEHLAYSVRENAWWRRSLNLGLTAVAFAHDVSVQSEGTSTLGEHWVVATDAGVWREQTTGTSSFTGAFVDTKDFSFPMPTTDDYYDRIKVDWEPMTNEVTDAFNVYGWARNDLVFAGNPLSLGQLSLVIRPAMTLLGTLSAGISELPIRTRGKYVRFRFEQSSGRVRIRGFSLRRQAGSPRPMTTA